MSARQRRWLLTGGIGSAKSDARRVLHNLGVHTIDADSVGHRVLEGAALAPVAERWPDVIKEGIVDRAALARIVFSDSAELRELEAITHPLIFGRIEAELEGFADAVVVEMPLITGLEGWRRMVVDARDQVRLERALQREMSHEDVEARMASQPSRSEWLALADLVIPNQGSISDLESTVEKLVPYLLPQERE